ncbi:MAG: toprim domain-containing protein, partial [Proteobacteria bacterium]|nr:toprim domain-containing protein [Pseudomonadota bacterium]
LIREHGFVAVVEGYFDQWAFHRHGIPAVAVMGTAITPEHLTNLTRYTQQIVMVMDTDSAGAGATIKSIPTLLASGCEVKVFSDLQGKDPADWLSENKISSKEVRSKILSGSEALQWWVERIIEDGRGKSLDRTQIAKRADHRRLLAGLIATVLMQSGSDENSAAKEAANFLDRLLKENPVAMPAKPRSAKADAPSEPWGDEPPPYGMPSSTPPPSASGVAPALRAPRSRLDALMEETFCFYARHADLLNGQMSDADLQSLTESLRGSAAEAVFEKILSRPKRAEILSWIETQELTEDLRRWILRAAVETPGDVAAGEESKLLDSLIEFMKTLKKERLRGDMARVQNELRKSQQDSGRALELLDELQKLRFSLENV